MTKQKYNGHYICHVNQSKTERTRAYIIEMTAPIFNKQGYAGTSITDLTAATKLTSGSIYGNFANKEEVALAALDYNISCFMKALSSATAKAKTPKDKLFGYIKAFSSSGSMRFHDGGCPIQNALCDADDTMEPLRQRAAEGLKAWKQELAAIVDQGILEGIFKADTKSDQIALHVIALCEFAMSTYSATKSLKQTDEILDMAIEVAKAIIV
ncbi:TetR/AcrR family transcriptional regulator [Mucilaginibacter sp. SG564]|uniref:TetR/AcrR family transcriptional regulator n=1 Tax=Mucilaginibacter sp. SG564 TaxID=2587022 RepID=UPI001554C060|nr:TetR/AcrR family transcriptional regulator [Mucilaginibacter sp. SG564]NOW94966.1 AcrR family transcriptional regulator [Mucilaginibacter sp. SG564]